MPQPKKAEAWEERFDQKFGHREHKDDCRIHDPIDYDFGCNCGMYEGDKEVKDFIRSTLEAERARCARVANEIRVPARARSLEWRDGYEIAKKDIADAIKSIETK